MLANDPGAAKRSLLRNFVKENALEKFSQLDRAVIGQIDAVAPIRVFRVIVLAPNLQRIVIAGLEFGGVVVFVFDGA